jgi:hypothetical protein
MAASSLREITMTTTPALRVACTRVLVHRRRPRTLSPPRNLAPHGRHPLRHGGHGWPDRAAADRPSRASNALSAAVLCVVIAVLSTGCTTTMFADPAPVTTRSSTASPEHAPASPANGSPAPPSALSWLPASTHDRPDSAVIPTLLSLDPCSLLDTSTVRALHLQVGDGTVPVTSFLASPHTCGWSADSVSFDTVYVTLGAAADPLLGQQDGVMHPTPVAGKLAYTLTTTEGLSECTIWLPVNGDLLVRVTAQRGDQSTSDVCHQARTAATTVVSTLSSPTPAIHPGPLMGWDACVVLADVLGSTAHRYTIKPLEDATLSALDVCTAIPADDAGHLPTSGSGYPGQRTIQIEYDGDPTQDTTEQIVRIGGHPGAVVEVTGACGIDWVYRPDPSGRTGIYADLTITNGADTCADARADAAATQRTLGRPPPTGGARTRQLLYPAAG